MFGGVDGGFSSSWETIKKVLTNLDLVDEHMTACQYGGGEIVA